jgi:hypothetical protein
MLLFLHNLLHVSFYQLSGAAGTSLPMAAPASLRAPAADPIA